MAVTDSVQCWRREARVLGPPGVRNSSSGLRWRGVYQWVLRVSDGAGAKYGSSAAGVLGQLPGTALQESPGGCLRGRLKRHCSLRWATPARRWLWVWGSADSKAGEKPTKHAKMQIMQRATRVKARPVSRLAGMGAKSYISVSGDRQCRCWLLAAGCCYEVVLAPAVSVRHTIPRLTRAPDTGDPALSRETSPQILSDVDDDGECKINPSLGLPNLACLTGQSQTPTANRNLRVSRPNGNLWVQLQRGEGAVQEGEREGGEGREKEPSSRQTRFYFMGREGRRKVRDVSEREETADGERTGEGGWKTGARDGSTIEFPVSSTRTSCSTSTRRSGQDRTEIVEGQGTWMARTGWAFMGGGRWEVRDFGQEQRGSKQEQRGRAQQSRAEQSRAEQSRAASKATMRTSTISSPSENCVKGSATPPDCPPPYCAHRDKFFSLSSTYKDPEWVVAAAGAEGSSRGSTGAGAGPRSTEASSQPSQPSQAQPGPTTICWAPSLLRGGTTGGPPGRGAGMTPRAWWDRGIRGTRDERQEPKKEHGGIGQETRGLSPAPAKCFPIRPEESEASVGRKEGGGQAKAKGVEGNACKARRRRHLR
ncbi:hypothetical protein BGZ57DRAFT_859901 [Hyaloscypha finlandica]|nr:hypothetical protein BGZ57DRAFT_859901 [Hyaloscypha finlandica]